MSMILFALAAAAASDADPLARARAGEVQCFHPDVLFKTCMSLETYVVTAGGGYLNRGANLVMLGDMFVIETEVPVEVRGNAVCATMRAPHVTSGKVTLRGQPVAPEKAAAVAADLKKKLVGVLDKEICTTYAPTDGSGYMANMKVAGGKALASPFIWVKPADGYKVGP